MTCHLASKMIPRLPQARIITEITKELILVFSLQGGVVFFRLKHTSFSKAEKFAALPEAAPQESQRFMGKICSTATKTIS